MSPDQEHRFVEAPKRRARFDAVGAGAVPGRDR